VEFSAILGLFAGIILLFWAISTRGAVTTFWDPAALLIVLGGTVAAVAVSHGWQNLRRGPRLVARVFARMSGRRMEVRNQLLHLAGRARREGLLALEDDLPDIDEPFLQQAVQMLVDATPPEDLKEVMNRGMEQVIRQEERGGALFASAGAASPAFGMIGTLIGLIHMLQDLEDPDTIGTGMAVALITTFYGSLMANLVFTPMARKLNEHTDEEQQVRQMIIEGVLAIQEGSNPRLIASKLDTYIQEPVRDQEEEGENEARAGEPVMEERSDVASND